MPLAPGVRLGSYAVTAMIGQGGMGEVYRANDTTLDRDVAIKVLPDAFASDPDAHARGSGPGRRFFPTRTRACLNGSSFGGSCLKLGWVGLGLHMEFHTQDQWIITSHIRAIAVKPSASGPPN